MEKRPAGADSETYRVLAAAFLLCPLALAASEFIVRRLLEGTWQVRKAVIVTLPFGIIWGIFAAALVLLATRFRGGRGTNRTWSILGGVAGGVFAVLSHAILGPPGYTGTPGVVGLLSAGIVCGALLGLLAHREHPRTRAVGEDSLADTSHE